MTDIRISYLPVAGVLDELKGSPVFGGTLMVEDVGIY